MSLEERIAELNQKEPNVEYVVGYVAALQFHNKVGVSLKGVEEWGGKPAVDLLLSAGIMEVFTHTQKDVAGALEMIRFTGSVPATLRRL